MSKEKQKKEEKEIFEKFIKSPDNPLKIIKWEKRNPPEPDIYCELSDGKTIAFELTESIDKGLKRLLNRNGKLRKYFYNYLEKLPIEQKEKFKENFKKTLIYIYFRNEISDNEIQSNIPNIFEILLNLPKNFNGDINLKYVPTLKKIIMVFTVSRLIINILEFDIGFVCFIEDLKITIEKGLNNKFNKVYKTNANEIHLLVYLKSSYGFPVNYWLPDVKELLKEKIKTSKSINRVWIYLDSKNKILFVHPELKH